MIAGMFDSIVAAFNPEAGLRRVTARAAYNRVRSYDAGKDDRTKKRFQTRAEGADTPNLLELQNVRVRAWDLYRNNHHARKIVRTIVAQVVGCALHPESLAMTTESTPKPATDFRSAAKRLWNDWGSCCDYAGLPGIGGQTLQQVMRLMVRELVVSGEALIRFRTITDAERKRRGMPIQLALELIPSEMLSENENAFNHKVRSGAHIFRGIEYDDEGRRVAYHFYRHYPNDPKWWSVVSDTVRVPVDEILHVYAVERIGQQRGVSWFAPALLQLRDIGDYQHNELMASAVAACVSLIVTTSMSGVSGLNAPAGATVTDTDGNQITRMQPGLIANVTGGESVTPFNPQRPSGTAEGYTTHLLRGCALSFPGVKPSTIHGDYRGSSYSSEKSADNDCWRETEQIQEDISATLCQPIWSRMIETGMRTGWFTEYLDQRVFRLETYLANRHNFDSASWHGPVALSINPDMDEKAIAQSIKNGTGSVPDGCAGKGYNWREIIDKQAEVMEYAKSKGLPDGVISQLLGIDAAPQKPNVAPDMDQEAALDAADEAQDKQLEAQANQPKVKVAAA